MASPVPVESAATAQTDFDAFHARRLVKEHADFDARNRDRDIDQLADVFSPGAGRGEIAPRKSNPSDFAGVRRA